MTTTLHTPSRPRSNPVRTGAETSPAAAVPAPAGADELARLLDAVNAAAGRLHDSHDVLTREVRRLTNELERANEQVQRARRLAALGAMAAGIAHEVRNPLASMALYARLLEQDLADRPAQRALAGRITEAIRGLDALVGDVLSLARELRVDRSAIDASTLLDRALEEVMAGWPDAPVTIDRQDLRRVPSPLLEADPALMHRALVNVIRNAVEAMVEQPQAAAHLTTDARSVMDSATGRSVVVIRIADTGPGVSRHVLERMFDPFFTTRSNGTGLGLAMVHRIMEAHGGRVQVRSRGRGGRRRRSGTIVELHVPGPGAAASEQAGARSEAIVQAQIPDRGTPVCAGGTRGEQRCGR